MRALAADVQRLLAEDLVIAASAMSPPEASQAAIDHLLRTVVRELGALAGARDTHRSWVRHTCVGMYPIKGGVF